MFSSKRFIVLSQYNHLPLDVQWNPVNLVTKGPQKTDPTNRVAIRWGPTVYTLLGRDKKRDSLSFRLLDQFCAN